MIRGEVSARIGSVVFPDEAPILRVAANVGRDERAGGYHREAVRPREFQSRMRQPVAQAPAPQPRRDLGMDEGDPPGPPSILEQRHLSADLYPELLGG